MVGKVLVTTALEETWPKDGEPTLFLGEWCRIYTRSEQFGQINGEVADYHWDDREKLYRDYLWLDEIYENALRSLARNLNEIHGVNHSIRYWRILVGPWLGYFIQMLYDRWYMLNVAVEEYEVTECRVIKRNAFDVIPNDMAEFQSWFTADSWNESIYGELLDRAFSNQVNLTLIEQSSLSGILKDDASTTQNKKNVKSYVKSIANFISDLGLKSDRFFLSSTYLPFIVESRLRLRLGQLPRKNLPAAVPRYAPDMSMRHWELDDLQCKSSHPFAQLTSYFVPQHLPTAYLEGYSDLSDLSRLSWPRNPDAIFTSNSYSADDMFKAYAAEKIEMGSKLVIGQHGGHLGMTPFAFYEKHQIDIADRWLSWGWRDIERPTVSPVGNFKEASHSVRYDPFGEALMVEMGLSRYSYHMYTVPVARQWLDYFDEQKRFVSSLPDSLRDQLIIRLFPIDYGWCQRERWNDAFPRITLGHDKINIRDQVRKSRLYISTYNATTYLESLAWNVPTIMFWKPEHWELKPEAIPYFNMLQSVGIFHKSPESAASKMIEVWDDVDEWWKSKEVQEVRNTFCEQFNYISKNIMDRLVSSMKFDRVESNI